MIVEDIYKPIITSPSSSNYISGGYQNITWQNSLNINNDFAYYVIYFTDNYNVLTNNFINIGIIPISSSSFYWKIPSSYNSSNCCIGMVAKKFNGDYSNVSISNVFTITSNQVVMPFLSSPEANSSYHRYIQFSFNSDDLMSKSQNNEIFIYYKSQNLNIDWTLLTGSLPYSSFPFYFDTNNLKSSNDYSFKIFAKDPIGNISSPIIISNISINPLENIIIDTVPPKGYVYIQKTSQYTNNINTILSLNAFDNTTGVNKFFIQQLNSNTNTLYTGPLENSVDTYPWNLQGPDGTMYIQGIFSDFAGNLSGESGDNLQKFTQYLNFNNQQITSTFYDSSNSNFYSAINGNPSIIFENLSQLTNVSGTINSIIKYNNILYFGGFQNNKNAILYSFNVGKLSSIFSQSNNDSEIKNMIVFNNILYIGLETGDLYSYFNNNISFVNNLGNAIEKMYSKNNLLYISTQNNTQLIIYDGNTFFNTVGAI